MDWVDVKSWGFMYPLSVNCKFVVFSLKVLGLDSRYHWLKPWYDHVNENLKEISESTLGIHACVLHYDFEYELQLEGAINEFWGFKAFFVYINRAKNSILLQSMYLHVIS